MKRLYSIQIVVVAAFLVVSFFSTLRLGAQGGDIDQDYLLSAERGPEKHVVVLIDNSRSVAIYNGQMGGPINEVADFIQFLVRYLKVFEPDAHIGVRVFANGAEDIDIILDSQPALEWTDQEIESIEPFPCPSVGTSPDPCDTRLGPANSTDAVAMVIALDWAVGQLSQCQGEPGAVDCSILVFTDGRYERSGGSLETISVAEKLKEISNNLPVRIIPFGVGNHPTNARDESPQILDPDLYRGVDTQTWREIWQQAFISPTVDINFYFRNPSNFSTGRNPLLQKFKAVVGVPDNIEVESVETRSILRPIDPLLEPSLYPHISGVHLKIAYPPSVSISSPLLPNRPTGSELILERARQIESISAIAEGSGFIAYQFQLITIDPHVDIRLEPQAIHEDNPITLTVALTTPYDVLGSRWIRSIQANLQPDSRYPQPLNLGWDQSAQVWVRTLNEGLPSDVYTVTFEVIPNSEWSNSWPSLPLQKTFVVEAPRWTYELALLESTVVSEQPITITLNAFRNGEPSPLPENVSIKVEFEPVEPYGQGSNQMLQADQISKLGDGIVLDGLKDTGTYTVSAEIKLSNGRTFDGIPQVLEVVLAPIPVVATPTPTLTDTPTPTPTATPSHTATPSPMPSATATATATETSISTPIVTKPASNFRPHDLSGALLWGIPLLIFVMLLIAGFIKFRPHIPSAPGNIDDIIQSFDSIKSYLGEINFRSREVDEIAKKIIETCDLAKTTKALDLLCRNSALKDALTVALKNKDPRAINLLVAAFRHWSFKKNIKSVDFIYDADIYHILTTNISTIRRFLAEEKMNLGNGSSELDKNLEKFLDWSEELREIENRSSRRVWVDDRTEESDIRRLEKLLEDMSTEGNTKVQKLLKIFFGRAKLGQPIVKHEDDYQEQMASDSVLHSVIELLDMIKERRASALLSEESVEDLRWLQQEFESGELMHSYEGEPTMVEAEADRSFKSSELMYSHEGRLLKIIIHKVWLVEE